MYLLPVFLVAATLPHIMTYSIGLDSLQMKPKPILLMKSTHKVLSGLITQGGEIVSDRNIFGDAIDAIKNRLQPPAPSVDDEIYSERHLYAEPQGACKNFKGKVHVTCKGPLVNVVLDGLFLALMNCQGGKLNVHFSK